MIYYFQYANGEKFIYTDVAITSNLVVYLQFNQIPFRAYPYNLRWIPRWELNCATVEYKMHTYLQEENATETSMEEVV